MNDDDFSNLVRSGTEHQVSVSEHTGNAKTPKNIVTSHEEETEARKRAFELQALAALEAEKALAAALAEHIDHIALEPDAASANIQKVAAGNDAENRQAIPSEGAVATNVQQVSSDTLKDNVQQISTDDIKANIQSVGHDKGIATNMQSVATDVIAANQQQLDGGHIAINRQTLDSDMAMAPNLQSLPKDDATSNRQSIAHESTPKNQSAIHTDATGPHTQNVATLGAPNNQQSIEPSSLSVNRQALTPESSTTPNNQAVGTNAPTLNRQAAPQTPPPGPNRQSVSNERITSHHEALPSGAIERKKVNFPTGTTNTSGQATASKPSLQTSVKAAPKAAPAAPQEAKFNREQVNSSFHGRLAGIKHNVDALNNRLTDFEDKVQKEDVNLPKGNPDNFKVDLD